MADSAPAYGMPRTKTPTFTCLTVKAVAIVARTCRSFKGDSARRFSQPPGVSKVLAWAFEALAIGKTTDALRGPELLHQQGELVRHQSRVLHDNKRYDCRYHAGQLITQTPARKAASPATSSCATGKMGTAARRSTRQHHEAWQARRLQSRNLSHQCRRHKGRNVSLPQQP